MLRLGGVTHYGCLLGCPRRNQDEKPRGLLGKHYKRYEQYQQGLGQAVSSVANVLASDEGLLRALAPQPEARPESSPDETEDSAAKPVDGKAIAKSILDRVSGKQSISPDMFIVFSTRSLLWSDPRTALDENGLRELEPVARIRSGQAFFNKVLIIKGEALQIAGVPIRDAKGDLIGGLILGVKVERYMKQYQVQSDKRERMQHQLSLVH
ncbi:MAG: hypothetical protein JKY56_24900, partial [Kofleriaceae bacterium]|nr:hypothetical protein [Kofleriaceae bacterium]